jgi:hypothetical protein
LRPPVALVSFALLVFVPVLQWVLLLLGLIAARAIDYFSGGNDAPRGRRAPT